MYPEDQLRQLGARKAALRKKIARQRVLCLHAAAGVVGPLRSIDHAVSFWRRLQPLARFAAPLGFLLARSRLRRASGWGRIFRWAPLVATAVRSIAGRKRSPPRG